MNTPTKNLRQTKKLLFVVLSSVVICGASQPAHATVYYANSSDVTLGANSTTVAEAKYRLSYSNWDQSLSTGAGTQTSSTYISNNLVGYGLSSLTSPTQFGFTFEYRANEGFIYTMTNLADPSKSFTLAWGSNFGALDGSVVKTAATLGGGEESHGFAPTASFNSLAINLLDTRNKPGTAMSLNSLTFTGTDAAGNALTLGDGSLVTSETALFGSTPATQYIFASTDLSKANWALSGVVSGSRDNSSSSDEAVKFFVDAFQNNFSVAGSVGVAPEPGSIAALVALGLVSCGGSALSRMRSKYVSLFKAV